MNLLFTVPLDRHTLIVRNFVVKPLNVKPHHLWTKMRVGPIYSGVRINSGFTIFVDY